MKDISITGIIPPVITPFKESGEPDLDAYGRLLDFLLEHVHGLYPLGTYGSGPLMPKEMRMRLAEFIVKKVDGRVPVIMHIGAADAGQQHLDQDGLGTYLRYLDLLDLERFAVLDQHGRFACLWNVGHLSVLLTLSPIIPAGGKPAASTSVHEARQPQGQIRHQHHQYQEQE